MDRGNFVMYPSPPLSSSAPLAFSPLTLFLNLLCRILRITFCNFSVRCGGFPSTQAVSLAVDPAMIDRVFSGSSNLSTEAVKHFVTQLCAVSSQEVNHSAATFR